MVLQREVQRDTAFACAPAATLPKANAFACGAAVREGEILPFLASLAQKLDDEEARASLTVEGGPGWELTFHEPVIAGGHINTTLYHEPANQVQMLSNSLAITCLFFGIEEGRA